MDLFHIIGKHAVSAAISCVAVFFAVCAYTLVTPPQYSATAQVFATYSDASVRDDDISSINSASTYIAQPDQVVSGAGHHRIGAAAGHRRSGIVDDGAAGRCSADRRQSRRHSVCGYHCGKPVTRSNPPPSRTVVAESLQDVVQTSLYDSGQQSPGQAVHRAAGTGTCIAELSETCRCTWAVGLVGGVIVGVVVALLRDLLLAACRRPAICRISWMRAIMGRVPEDASLKSAKPVLVSAPGGQIAEEFRRVRTNTVLYCAVEGLTSRLIVVSSVGMNEGKTTIAGEHRRLVRGKRRARAADRCRPAPPFGGQTTRHRGRRRAGACAVLPGRGQGRGPALLEAKLPHTCRPDRSRPNASTLLSSDVMREMIHQALTQYDYVVIDTSPLDCGQ